MDTKMIGSFLKELRKENNMTQEQLGERIGVTNKTVSRWETGNYMPPVESLILLSDIYGISINEILAGKRVEMDELKQVADENMTKVLGELEGDYKKFEKRMIVILIINAVEKRKGCCDICYGACDGVFVQCGEYGCSWSEKGEYKIITP